MPRPSFSPAATALDTSGAASGDVDAARLRRTILLVLGLVVVFLVVWRWPLPTTPFSGAARYVPLHIALETASIVAAMLVFGITWASYARERPGNVVILGCALFVAALIDFVHLLSFAGMPDLITPAGQEKAINFWLSARLVVAVAFLVAALRPWGPLRYPRVRYVALAVGLAITALVVWAGLYHQAWWPRTFIVGQGLTPFKVGAEYAIDAIMVVPAVVFFVRARRGTRDYDATGLFAAVAVSILSELAFTLYTDVTDIFNLLGHVYKVIAYIYLYRAMFVSSVRQPMERAVRAEAETRRATQWTADLLANLPTAVVVHAPDSRVTYGNPAALAFLGLTEAQILGREASDPAWRFVREDGTRLAVDEYPVARVLASRDPLAGVVVGVVPSAHAEARWAFVTGFPVLDAAGAVREVVVTFMDVSERVAADLKLRRLNRELRAITLCNEALVRAEDEDALLREICRIVHEAAGYPLAWVGIAEDDEAKTVRPVAASGDVGYLDAASITWADEPRGRGPSGTAIRTGQSVKTADFATAPEGAPWREAALVHGFRSNVSMPLRGHEGHVFGVLSIYATAVDAFTPEETRLLEELAGDLAFGVTILRAREAQARLEAQLRQSQKMEVVGQLAGGIAHDFNNLLAAIRGYSELLRDELPTDDEVSRRDLEEVLAAAGRAELLTRQLLAFARRQVLVPVVLQPGEILAALAPMLRRVLGEQVELVTMADPDAGLVRADAGQLEQVILNLAINARDAMPGGGRLTIDVTCASIGERDRDGLPTELGPGEYVLLRVADTGIGMDEATLARLFEPFFTTKPEGMGTGLGLPTVYGIVRQSGGAIDFASAPGAGTTVRVFLPRVEAEAAASAAEAADRGATPRGEETVLLVEDDPSVRGFAARILRGLGYAVLEAGSGPDALGLASAHKGAIDVLVSDIVMPGMPGTVLARQLAEARPGLRVLFMSAYSSGALGPDLPPDVAFLPKPFSADALGRALRAVLEGAAAPAG